MKTRHFQMMATLALGIAMTCVTMTSCSVEDNSTDIPGDVPTVGGNANKVDGNWTYIISGNNATLTGYIGSDKAMLTTLNIPLKVGGKFVTYVSPWEMNFSEFKNLVTLNFDKDCLIDEMPSVKDCSKLQHINFGKEADKLPASMKTVKGQTFKGTAIKNINLNMVETVGSQAFKYCNKLESVDAPNAISLGEEAFAFIESKCTVTIPLSPDMLSWQSVRNSPQILVKCNGGANGWCGDDDSVAQDFLYWKIKVYVLDIACTQQGIENYPDKQVIKTHRWLDYDPTAIKILELKDVYAIGKESFKGMNALESVTLNDGLTSIGESAFENCTSLKFITIPASVTSIGSKAFAGCTGLKVDIKGNPTIDVDAFPDGVTFMSFPIGLAFAGPKE